MELELTDLLWLALLAGAGWLWWRAQGARELALRAARRHCDQEQVQLLDDTVAAQRFWWRRGRSGHLTPWWLFEFEFTATGDDRYRGSVVILGGKVETVHLEPHRFYH